MEESRCHSYFPNFLFSPDISVVIELRLRAGPPRNRISIPGNGRRFFSSATLRTISKGHLELFLWCPSMQAIHLSTSLHLDPKFRNLAAVRLLLLYAVMAGLLSKHSHKFTLTFRIVVRIVWPVGL
jgi:hypothetical protein